MNCLQVGTSDALAFFLPGVVSKFTKVLGFARTMSSGAAGNIEAMNQSIRGLAEYLMIVLDDDANSLCLEISKMNSEIYDSTDSFLKELRRLPIRDQGREVLSEYSDVKVESKKTVNEIQEQKNAGSSKGLQTLTVNRTKEWVEETSANVHKLLSATFPHVCAFNFMCYEILQGISECTWPFLMLLYNLNDLFVYFLIFDWLLSLLHGFSDLCSSSKKVEKRTSCCYRRNSYQVQQHTKRE